MAVALYRRYLIEAPSGTHAEAARLTLGRLEALPQSETIDPTPPASDGARRVAITSPVRSAMVRIDRGKPLPLPAFVEVTAGKHKLIVTAAGYVCDAATIEVAAGGVEVTSIALDPKPALLDVQEPAGAEIFVDGTSVGTAPTTKPVALEPGHHTVTLALNGHAAKTREVTIARGHTEHLSMDLPSTRQRTAAWVLLGTGGAAVAAGIGLGVAAVVRDREAGDLGGPRGSPLETAATQRFDEDIRARDRLRVGAGIAGGAGVGLAALGGFLFAIDQPSIKAARPARSAGQDLRVVPFAPGSDAGVGMVLRF